MGSESVWLGNFADGFEVTRPGRHEEHLARAIGAYDLDAHVMGVKVIFASKRESEARRYAVFKYFKRQWTDASLKLMSLVMIVFMTDVGVAVRVAVVMAPAA